MFVMKAQKAKLSEVEKITVDSHAISHLNNVNLALINSSSKVSIKAKQLRLKKFQAVINEGSKVEVQNFATASITSKSLKFSTASLVSLTERQEYSATFESTDQQEEDENRNKIFDVKTFQIADPKDVRINAGNKMVALGKKKNKMNIELEGAESSIASDVGGIFVAKEIEGSVIKFISVESK